MRAFFEQQITSASIGPGDNLLVAVSGGVDSVVLLHLLSTCAAQFEFCLSVAHLDHQLRPESSADADFVRQLCAELKLPCIVGQRDVRRLASEKAISLEMAGREARREFLLHQAEQVGARLIVLAHHRDDQVETFLLRLLRGSGVAGLAAMQILQGCWWRPLLDCSQGQVLAYAQQHGLAWVEDSSNADPVFLRNRLRHQLLPDMREINPQLDERLAELCRQLQVDEDYWQTLIDNTLPGLIVSTEDGLRLDRQKLLVLSEALRLRVIREALRRMRGDLQGLEAVHLHAIVELLEGERSQSQLDLPGCWVARRYNQLWLREQAPDPFPAYDLLLPVPGEVALPCGRILRTRLVAKAVGEKQHAAEFVWAEIDTPLRVRSWQAGDSFVPQGLGGSKKIKRLFGDQKIEKEQRLRVPLLVSGEAILWVVGMRRSCHAAVIDDSNQVLRLELLESA